MVNVMRDHGRSGHSHACNGMVVVYFGFVGTLYSFAPVVQSAYQYRAIMYYFFSSLTFQGVLHVVVVELVSVLFRHNHSVPP